MSKKYLIVYFTRTGRTKSVAEYLQNELSADCEEIIDKSNYKGGAGFLKGIVKSRAYTKIKDIKYIPSDYDEVIIMSPIWADAITPAIRTYIKENCSNIALASIITTAMKSNLENVGKEWEKFSMNINKVLYINQIDDNSLLELKEKLVKNG